MLSHIATVYTHGLTNLEYIKRSPVAWKIVNLLLTVVVVSALAVLASSSGGQG